MKRRIIGTLTAAFLSIVAAIAIVAPTAAATTASGTITYTPAYLTVSLSGTFAMGNVLTSTSYYSNPLGVTTAPSATVLDTECSFTLTYTNTVAMDLYCNIPDFTGGSDPMTNVNGVTAGATTFAAWSYYSGMTTFSASKVLAKSSGSGVLKSNITTGTGSTLKVGCMINTQTNPWAGGTGSGSNAVYSIAIH